MRMEYLPSRGRTTSDDSKGDAEAECKSDLKQTSECRIGFIEQKGRS